VTYARLLSEALAADALPSTGDVLSVGLPLLRQIDELHRAGSVTRLSGTDLVVYDGESLSLAPGSSGAPRRDDAMMRRLDPERPRSGVEIARRVDLDHGLGEADALTSLDVFDGETDRPDRPMFVVGHRAWEQWYGVHDELTDVHLVGQLLAGYALGLDLGNPDHVHELALRHRHLLSLNPAVHPVVAGVLTDMLTPDRHRRPADVTTVIATLEHHRELPPDLDLSDAYRSAHGWQRAVLSTLRERVFDLTRRNRALYFRPTASTVSLTEASVPLLLDVNRVRPDDILTWTGKAATALRSGKTVDLEQWCRFEEAPHLAPALDTLISNERKLRAEHGQGRLQLIAAFLRWVDPESGETVSSPLLVAPAELSRKKGVRHRYRVRVDQELDVNPVLRHLFRTRFGVTLPEQIDGDETSIRALVDRLESAVRATDPSVRIELVDTPRINLIRRRAQLRVDAYRRRRARAAVSHGRWRRQDHSYDRDDWRPLGLELYRRFVRPADLPMRSLTDAPPRPRPQAMAATLPPPTGGPNLRPGQDTGTREQTNYAVATGDVNRHRWEVDLCAVTLASLGTRRTNLVRDYDHVLAIDGVASGGGNGLTAESFEAIFAPSPRRAHATPAAAFSVDQPLVLPADEAQAQAVDRAVAGESFIIQGPPGTGKSQTITNLLAGLVADGKRVLFVCEKRAALDVVAHRLRQVGLGELVATIHDSQLDRKDVIADLGRTYQAWLADDVDEREAERERALRSVHDVLDPLQRAFAELTDERADRPSLASTIDRLITLRMGDVEPAERLPDGLDEPSWRAARPALDRVIATATSAGHTAGLDRLAALRIAPDAIGDDPVVSARTVGSRLGTALAALTPGASGPALERVTVGDVRKARLVLDRLSALSDLGMLAVFDRSSGAHLELRTANSSLDDAASTATTASQALDRWSAPLDGPDARAALDVARRKEGSAFKFLSGAWRRVNGLVRASYRFDQHQIEPTVTQVLTELVEWHDANDEVGARRAALAAAYGTADVGDLLIEIERVHDNPLVAALASGARTVPAIDAVGALAAAIEPLVLESDLDLLRLRVVAVGLERTSVVDEPVLLAWSGLTGAPEGVLLAALLADTGPDRVERVLLDAVIERAGGGRATIGGARLDEMVDVLLARYRDLLGANAGMVAARARRRFLAHVELASSSVAGRSDADKELKRAYSAGRRLLEREFQKKMRFRSIRELAAGDSGAVVRDLKPIWLMSPLSVSDTLPLDDGSFDAVVFDEASQIPVEDAVPSLFRAPQVVVVGDRMQLPPTRFFATDAGVVDGDVAGDVDGDDLGMIAVDDDGHRITVALDADSFLTQADLALPSSTLTWHYRSRSESLIAYSNHAFYGANLATVPDREFPADESDEIVVRSPQDARDNLAEVMRRPISFHRLPYGVYEQRRNEPEADYIAELVRAVLSSGSGLTIGIVAFSEAQQGEIETALAELAAVDPEFAERLDAEQNRIVDGEYVGMFVKNLENVQGDERELIIMSVCYGPAANGKMRMNFGPINQAGGERRLNVIFSRAKRHMAIVSSIEGTAITNTHNDGAAHLARFLDYAAAESRGSNGGERVLRALHADRGGLTAGGRSAVATELADRLRDAGHRVDVGVGRSDFTIDVGVRGDDGYELGIVLDPGDDGTAANRTVAEAGVLDAFGWPITRVLVSEWWASPDEVIGRIDHTLRTGARGE
jgi:hypothetical protein